MLSDHKFVEHVEGLRAHYLPTVPRTKFGKTALMQAVEKNSLESAAALLMLGSV